jgi:hypothetical protein
MDYRDTASDVLAEIFTLLTSYKEIDLAQEIFFVNIFSFFEPSNFTNNQF